MVRAVTIDFWNTLFDTSNGDVRKRYRDNALYAALNTVGFPWDTERIRVAYQKAYDAFEQEWFDSKKTQSASDSVGVIWEQLGVTMPRVTHDAVVRAFEESILKGMPQPMPGAFQAVEQLVDLCPVAIISDTATSPGSALRKVLAHYGFNELITTCVFSDETGIAKPHPEAFRTALRKLGDVTPRDAVHIGDIERTDVAGAKQFGMKAILFSGDPGKHHYNDGVLASLADATADSWEKIPSIIHRWYKGLGS